MVYGNMSGMIGMRNVGGFFGVVWVWSKICMLGWKNDGCKWPIIFFGSVFMWRAALYLNDHPEFITTVFKQQ